MSYEETLERVIQRLDSEEKEKDKRIAELEKESAVRDLEQQAKGLIDFSITYNEMATNPDSLVNLLTYCANVLLGKTKALKDQG